MASRAKYDPFQTILTDSYASAPLGASPISDALRLLQQTRDVNCLKELLTADDPGIVSIGLQLLSELDSWVYPLMPEALKHVGSPDRRDRFYIANALLINHEHLNSEEIAGGLRLLADEDTAVRWKAIELVQLLAPARLDQVASSLLPSEHQEGVVAFRKIVARESLSGFSRNPNQVVQGYICAAIVVAAKLGMEVEVEGLTLSDQDEAFLARRLDRLRRFGR